MRRPLKIGIWSENPIWKNKVVWLLDDEFGFPSEPIDELKQFPLIVLSYANFIGNLDKITEYSDNNGSIVIVCTLQNKEKNESFECDEFPVEFGKRIFMKGSCVSDKSHIMASFFPERKVQPQKRKDHLLKAGITVVKNLSPTVKTVVNLAASKGSEHYPLLVCGSTKNNCNFAVITADENFLDFRDSYWPALIYLAAIEWCLDGKPFVRKWFWSNNKRMIIMLTFDFETLSMYRNHRKSYKFCWWNRRLDYLLLGLGMKRILPYMTKEKIPSTWFVLGSQAIHTPALVKKLASNDLIDFEGHGDFHEGIDRDTEFFDREAEKVQQERMKGMLDVLHRFSLKKVCGFRSPGLYANQKTLRALEKTGLQWDSSASQQTDYPIKWFFLPYVPVMNWESMKRLNLVEIPVTEPWDRWCPVHGSYHTPADYLCELLEDFSLMYRIGGMQNLLVHPYEIAVRYTWWNAIKAFVNAARKIPNVSFQTCNDVYDQWVSRMKLKVQATYDTKTKTTLLETRNENPRSTLMIYPEKKHRMKIETNCKSSYELKKSYGNMYVMTYKDRN